MAKEVSDLIAIGRDSIQRGAGFDRAFILSNLAATVIACAGLLAVSRWSTSTTGCCANPRDARRQRALVLAVGTLIGASPPTRGRRREMLSRTSPRLLDLLVALASGAIGACAVAAPRLSAAIVGVSIAVALVRRWRPPASSGPRRV